MAAAAVNVDAALPLGDDVSTTHEGANHDG
jgi:hypothetical protein